MWPEPLPTRYLNQQRRGCCRRWQVQLATAASFPPASLPVEVHQQNCQGKLVVAAAAMVPHQRRGHGAQQWAAMQAMGASHPMAVAVAAEVKRPSMLMLRQRVMRMLTMLASRVQKQMLMLKEMQAAMAGRKTALTAATSRTRHLWEKRLSHDQSRILLRCHGQRRLTAPGLPPSRHALPRTRAQHRDSGAATGPTCRAECPVVVTLATVAVAA